jgi:hypothetical protein
MEMGKKGREIVEKELSSEIINEQFINLYQSSINSFQDGQSS